MKKLMKLVAATALSALVLGTLFVTDVNAQTVQQDQELTQNIKVTCTSGSYGQNTTCTAESTQTGKQYQVVNLDGMTYIVREDGVRIPYHRPVNTSVTPLTMAGILSAAVASAGTALMIIKKK